MEGSESPSGFCSSQGMSLSSLSRRQEPSVKRIVFWSPLHLWLCLWLWVTGFTALSPRSSQHKMGEMTPLLLGLGN